MVETFWFHELSGRFPRNRQIKAESWENCAELFGILEAESLRVSAEPAVLLKKEHERHPPVLRAYEK